MKYLIIFIAIAAGASFWHKKTTCDPVSIRFAGKEWLFPSTAEEAVKKHQLAYKPPGYYYQIDKNGMEVILDFHNEPLDFDNEYQPKEVLFPRKLHSYIFRFPEKPGLYDSLKTSLEQVYKSKFVLTKGMKEGPTIQEHEKPFEYNFLTVSPCLTVGIKRSSPEKKEKIVTVRFMYDLPLGRMGVVMGSY